MSSLRSLHPLHNLRSDTASLYSLKPEDFGMSRYIDIGMSLSICIARGPDAAANVRHIARVIAPNLLLHVNVAPIFRQQVDGLECCTSPSSERL